MLAITHASMRAGVAAITYNWSIISPEGALIASGNIGHKGGRPLDYEFHGKFHIRKHFRGRIPPGSQLVIDVAGTLTYRGPSLFTGRYRCTF